MDSFDGNELRREFDSIISNAHTEAEIEDTTLDKIKACATDFVKEFGELDRKEYYTLTCPEGVVQIVCMERVTNGETIEPVNLLVFCEKPEAREELSGNDIFAQFAFWQNGVMKPAYGDKLDPISSNKRVKVIALDLITDLRLSEVEHSLMSSLLAMNHQDTDARLSAGVAVPGESTVTPTAQVIQYCVEQSESSTIAQTREYAAPLGDAMTITITQTYIESPRPHPDDTIAPGLIITLRDGQQSCDYILVYFGNDKTVFDKKAHTEDTALDEPASYGAEDYSIWHALAEGGLWRPTQECTEFMLSQLNTLLDAYAPKAD